MKVNNLTLALGLFVSASLYSSVYAVEILSSKNVVAVPSGSDFDGDIGSTIAGEEEGNAIKNGIEQGWSNEQLGAYLRGVIAAQEKSDGVVADHGLIDSWTQVDCRCDLGDGWQTYPNSYCDGGQYRTCHYKEMHCTKFLIFVRCTPGKRVTQPQGF